MKTRPSALIVENNHVLLLRYNYAQNDVFALPGGNPDAGETLTQALTRELTEELNIEVEIGELLMIGEVLQSPKRPDVLHCVFTATIIGGLPMLNAQHTTAQEVVWKPINALPLLNLYPNIGQNITMMKGGYLGQIEQPFFE
ncbi:MAG: NUDIX hydrolase [Spirosomaceae bacterium]|jgi:ADP-ribose pyrophosphatase YjhB (NUDIX family)|nr:NUDIX hydrolase [Spirosomataceae bacterium]